MHLRRRFLSLSNILKTNLLCEGSVMIQVHFLNRLFHFVAQNIKISIPLILLILTSKTFCYKTDAEYYANTSMIRYRGVFLHQMRPLFYDRFFVANGEAGKQVSFAHPTVNSSVICLMVILK